MHACMDLRWVALLQLIIWTTHAVCIISKVKSMIASVCNVSPLVMLYIYGKGFGSFFFFFLILILILKLSC